MIHLLIAADSPHKLHPLLPGLVPEIILQLSRAEGLGHHPADLNLHMSEMSIAEMPKQRLIDTGVELFKAHLTPARKA